MKKLLLFFVLSSIGLYGQSTISYSIVISSLPSCSTCCDGQAYVTAPTGGSCPGVYSYSCSSGFDGPSPFFGNLCYNTTYTVTVYNPCDTTRKTFTMPAYTGINEIKASYISFKLFPNPVSNTLLISTEQSEFENSEIEIINTLGQTVLELPYSNQIDVSQLSYGFYYLKISTQTKQIYYSKFIKE